MDNRGINIVAFSAWQYFVAQNDHLFLPILSRILNQEIYQRRVNETYVQSPVPAE
jgi:hypothetical protein